jgi:hypothetical protein
MAYFTNVGPAQGPDLYRDSRSAAIIDVLDSRDSDAPIGTAVPVGWDFGGEALWRLIVEGATIQGHWIAVDREFRPVQ